MLYAISLSLCRCGFSISSRRWLLMICISRLWSMIVEKCCKPARKSLHFITAQHTVSTSNSIVAYQDFASVRKQEPTWMRFYVVLCCCRMKPSPLLACIHAQASGLNGNHKMTALGAELSVHPSLLSMPYHGCRSTKIHSSCWGVVWVVLAMWLLCWYMRKVNWPVQRMNANLCG